MTYQFASVSVAGVGSMPGVLATTAWFFPFLLATVAYYQRTLDDPEQEPVHLPNN
jgi:hypothetical protein